MWDRLVSRVSFSSDEQGMPWEIMGVKKNLQFGLPDIAFSLSQKQDLAKN